MQKNFHQHDKTEQLTNYRNNMKNTTPCDKDGNYFLVKNPTNNIMTVHLFLASENKSRELGTVIVKERLMRIRRNREKHLLRKNQSYGFNEHLIKMAKKFDNIHLIEEHGVEYIFPREFVIDKGSYLHFKSEGFEKQLFVTLAELNQYIVKSESF